MSSNPDFSGNALEDRLRGLIMNNAGAESPALQIPSRPVRLINQVPVPTESWHPHMTPTSLDKQQVPSARQQANSTLQDITGPVPLVGSPPGSRRRPNQAQRRQMNSQLSMGVGSRSQDQITPSSGVRPFDHHHNQQPWSSPMHNGPHKPRGNFHGNTQRGQHHQSFHQPSMSVPYSQPYERVGLPTSSRDVRFGQNEGDQLQNSWRNPQSSGQPKFASPEQQPHIPRQPPQNRQLYQPGSYAQGRPPVINTAEIDGQAIYLDKLVVEHIPRVGIEPGEIDEKEEFRCMVEKLCQEAITEHEQQELGNEDFMASSVELKCFGSMASGFATKASDMDLAFLSPFSKPSPESSESPIPRILEKKLLGAGLGARLLTRTRVPIIKLCQEPGADLYEDLNNERLKWESEGAAEGGSDDEESSAPKSPEVSPYTNDKIEINGKSEAPAAVETPETIYKRRLEDLKQTPKQSIGDHYGNAKKLLFKLGGRDVGLSGVGDMSEYELKILHDVSSAFIDGLHDDVLRSSLSQNDNSDLSAFQMGSASPMLSLSGVFGQAEGDRLVLAWESRPLRDSTGRQEMLNERLIEDWRHLRAQISVDAATYNKQIHNMLDKLKRITSLQLVFLEQGSHEAPLQYQARTSRILRELGGVNCSGMDISHLRHIVSVVKHHYVNGVYNLKIKEHLANIITRSGDQMDSLFLYHRALQLGEDYSRALKTDLYDQSYHLTIKNYISALLREPGITSTLDEHLMELQLDSVVQDAATLLKRLPDPTTCYKPRDRYFDRLEFPKTGVGIQCDINFTAQLGLHNTLLLRCYSSADPRVRPLVLFVKSWAKIRGINTPYRGTLSSYGYVLMVLHYLVNVVKPFVLPNLQQLKRPAPQYLPPQECEAWDTCQGYDVGFWRNEMEIKSLAERGMLNHNHSSIGKLLRGFFEYYAQNNMMSDGCGKRGFEWGREVLSLRTPDGIITKQEKGWVGARTTIQVMTKGHSNAEPNAASGTSKDDISENLDAPQAEKQRKMSIEPEVKEIRHRYLFAIEDPFETTHNVARTVTHNGIVSIRDEFRRAWRIIRNVGDRNKEELLEDSTGAEKEQGFVEFLELLHGI